ncbi:MULTISPECIES: GFA family protein [unclassified Sphingopyxis]|uniref:GFA family protein n=1 Tax=unclassified Sphingopyxis TaxID=2614943 RepID=UPI0007366049|nr:MULTISPECIES: GFA family protein [unclassified Sphingopyxis]KTE31403.1 aldehyde-activating protein [Sphingopyxis sp. HIX]KTE81438.1 aldehyde-activating protein [Sphingopyxis sp. HXXIV]
MISRIARCHCGDIELTCVGEPRKISMCHCLECQRRTGSAFSIAVFYQREKVSVERGDPHSFERQSASGRPVKFHFCARCGSNLYWLPDRMPHLVGVAAGAFADPDFPMPDQSVWTRDKHGWLALPECMAQHDANPPPRA